MNHADDPELPGRFFAQLSLVDIPAGRAGEAELIVQGTGGPYGGSAV